jgi:hypothetical protein
MLSVLFPPLRVRMLPWPPRLSGFNTSFMPIRLTAKVASVCSYLGAPERPKSSLSAFCYSDKWYPTTVLALTQKGDNSVVPPELISRDTV